MQYSQRDFVIAGANNAKGLRHTDNKNGVPVVVADYNGGSDHAWKFEPNGTISLYNGAKCMDG